MNYITFLDYNWHGVFEMRGENLYRPTLLKIIVKMSNHRQKLYRVSQENVNTLWQLAEGKCEGFKPCRPIVTIVG